MKAVSRLLVMVGATVGSAAGWWLGAKEGTMTAFILSVVGTAALGYGARRLTVHYLG
jgi:hypothetical protein